MKLTNKRRQRTEVLRQATARRRMAEQADNAIEQHRFKRLIEQGVVMSQDDYCKIGAKMGISGVE